ncbi:MAG: hypothetical protein ACJ797_03230 [Ktedonobacteraceae bacterium]
MIATASLLFGFNGNLSRLLFDDGISPVTLVELRMLIWLGQHLDAWQLTGCLCVMVGVAILQYERLG